METAPYRTPKVGEPLLNYCEITCDNRRENASLLRDDVRRAPLCRNLRLQHRGEDQRRGEQYHRSIIRAAEHARTFRKLRDPTRVRDTSSFGPQSRDGINLRRTSRR